MGKSYHNNTYHHVYICCFIPILRPIGKDTHNKKISNMNSSISSPSPLAIPHIKDAKVVKPKKNRFYITLFTIIINHFHLKMNPTALKQFLLLENIWTHTSSILDIDLQPPLQNIHLSKLLFLNKKPPQFKHIEEQLTQLIAKFLLKKFSLLSKIE